jgi:CRISPR-associated protein Cmr6
MLKSVGLGGCYMSLRNKLFITRGNVVSFLKWKFILKVEEQIREMEESRKETIKRRRQVDGKDLKRSLSEFRYDIAKQLYEAYSSKEDIAILLTEAKKLIDESVKALNELGYTKIVDSNFITLTPLAIGLHNPYTEPLEISIAWDPYINLPYIPASSLKGAVASLAWADGSELYDLLSKKDEASPIVFLDSYPVEVFDKSLLALDIINPHYREAEGKISEPESSPTPLRFLVVSKHVAFRVVICIAKRWFTFHKQKLNLNELTALVSSALSRGVGAKTSLGYGRLSQKHFTSADS